MMMVLTAVQLMLAFSMDGCGTNENHGFNKQFDTTPHLRVLTFDIERLISDA